ncbi:MAG: ketoacyl-ACP synthase III [Lachnospiraceae bacterium]|nr:ketoacyl-ACP synthase III [Lachnospiraceae bacterium]
MNTKITGTGSFLPEKIVTNFDMEKLVDTQDAWIRERTGIASRHISTGETVSSIAAKAAKEALLMAGKQPGEVEMIIVATCSPEMLLPCCACQVQSILGCSNAVAFDLNAACSGFLFAFNAATAYIKTGLYKNALVIGAEVLSKIVDWTDRATCVLFGDGAGAAFLEATEEENIGMLSLSQGSDGARGMVLACEDRDVVNPFTEKKEQILPGYVTMNGQEVYKFAVRQVPASILDALEKANLTVEEIDHFVLHQANIRIIEAVAKRLKVPMDKFPTNLERVGNMSSATIPVLLDEINRAGKLKKGDKLVMSGFGAGLTYGAGVYIWG